MSQYFTDTDQITGMGVRFGIRDDNYYVIDTEFTPDGFDGEKDKDWGNLSSQYLLDESFFTIEIETTSANQSITLPLLETYNSIALSYNCFVDYGDESELENITEFDGANVTHVYATAGIYQIKILGVCESFCVNDGGFKTLITNIIFWGNTGLKVVNFRGCVNLESVPSDICGLGLLTSLDYMFYGCTNLVSLPLGLFPSCPLVTTAYRTFSHSGIVSVPSDLFSGCPNITSFIETFTVCLDLETLPSGLFANNTLVTSFAGTFGSCEGLTTIPSELFDNNTAVESFYTTFSLTGITSLPEGLFDHNTLVWDFHHCFDTCAYLSTVPTNLFAYNTAVTTFHCCFSLCVSLQALPIFTNNTSVTAFDSAFLACRSATGNAPDLWNTHPNAAHTDCFGSCTSLTNYASIPNGWKGL
jgi:hypothetical protein